MVAVDPTGLGAGVVGAALSESKTVVVSTGASVPTTTAGDVA